MEPVNQMTGWRQAEKMLRRLPVIVHRKDAKVSKSPANRTVSLRRACGARGGNTYAI
jgi:hypothetical protein